MSSRILLMEVESRYEWCEYGLVPAAVQNVLIDACCMQSPKKAEVPEQKQGWCLMHLEVQVLYRSYVIDLI